MVTVIDRLLCVILPRRRDRGLTAGGWPAQPFGMCNFYRRIAGYYSYLEDFSHLKIPLRFPEAAPNLEPQEDIRPTNTAPIIRALEPTDPAAGVGLYPMRWDLVPWFWKKTIKEKKFLATNARCETVATTASFREAFKRRRCLVPADGFYEWTGEKGAKTKWMFTRAGEPWFCFAGLWDHAETADGPVDSFTIITTAAGPFAREYHDRQPLILDRDQWARWLDMSQDASDLLCVSERELKVERAPPKMARA